MSFQGNGGGNPMGPGPGGYFSPTAGMMSGFSSTGMNPNLPQQQGSLHYQAMIKQQMDSTIYSATGGTQGDRGGDRRWDSLIRGMGPDGGGTLNPGQVSGLTNQGNASRNLAMAMINQNPTLNRMFGSYGNSGAVAMGARSIVDATANTHGSDYEGQAARVMRSSQLTNDMMKSIQFDKGGLRPEYGQNFEDVGFAMKTLATGGSMGALKSGPGNKGLDKSQTDSIKNYVKNTTDTLEALKNIYGPEDNARLARLAAEMTGLDPSKVQNAGKIRNLVNKQIAAAETLGYDPANFIDIQQRGAHSLRSMGMSQSASATFSGNAIIGSAVERERQMEVERNGGTRAMTTEAIHQRKMRSSAGMLGKGEAGSTGNMIMGIHEMLSMNESSGGKMMDPGDVAKYKRALEGGDRAQLAAVSSQIGSKYGYDISAQGSYHDMATRQDMLTNKQQTSLQSHLTGAQRNVNEEKYFNNMVGGAFGLAGDIKGSPEEKKKSMRKLSKLWADFGGAGVADLLESSSKAETVQKLLLDPYIQAEAKRLGIDPQELAEQKAGLVADVRGSTKNLGLFAGKLRRSEGFSDRDHHVVMSRSEAAAAKAADEQAEKLGKHRTRIKRRADLKATKGRGISDLALGILSGEFEAGTHIGTSGLDEESTGLLGDKLRGDRDELTQEIADKAATLEAGGMSPTKALDKARQGGKDDAGRDRGDQLELLNKAIKKIEDRQAGGEEVSRVEIVTPMIIRTADGAELQLVPVTENA